MGAGDSKERSINELQLRQHYTKESLWIKIDNNIYDVTKFQEQHPGGALALQSVAGKDATQEFKKYGHGENAIELSKKFIIGQYTELKTEDKKNMLELLENKEKEINQLKEQAGDQQFLKTRGIEQRKKYYTDGIQYDFTKSYESAVNILTEMDKLTKFFLESKDNSCEGSVEAEYPYLTTFSLYKYKLNKLLKLKYEKKKDEFSVFECAEEKSSIIMARGADNYAKKIAMFKDNNFEYHKDGDTRTIKIQHFTEEAPIIITYDNEGVVKTSQDHEELIGLDILHYIAAILHCDISYVTYNSSNQLVYFFESELIQKIPKKNKYVGQIFMSWHERSKYFADVLKVMLPNLMKCWAQKKLDVFIVDLRNRETYQHKFFKEIQLKRTQRDHYFGAFDENDNYLGIMLYTYVYFQKADQMELPYEGGEYYQFTSPQEFINSFEVQPFESI